ncbi:MAG: hypothetical protein HKN85_00870 [Gammaproteobacteria bacterium]|nr:hypothetical protein [Gammaproteobacteria bacterium]
MNDHHSDKSSLQADKLELLFAQARDSQPDLDCENFTKSVLNRLPTHPRRITREQYYADFIGLIVGLAMAASVVKPMQLFNKVLSLFPGNISISLTNLLIVSLVLSTLALLAWWSVERNPAL